MKENLDIYSMFGNGGIWMYILADKKDDFIKDIEKNSNETIDNEKTLYLDFDDVVIIEGIKQCGYSGCLFNEGDEIVKLWVVERV